MGRVKISDIAKVAGVSNATVSYALSETGRVSTKTREKILRISKEMGFLRDDTAAQLRTGKSSLIGVILNTVVNPFFSELVAALEMSAYEAGYLTLLATAQNDPVRQQKLLASMISQSVAGVVVSPVHILGPESLTELTARNIPTVVCVRDVPGSGAIFVGADEEMSGYLAASHLIEYGHRSFWFMGGYERTTTWQGRRNGVLKALAESGLPAEVCTLVPGSQVPDFVYQKLVGAYGDVNFPTAVLCFNDDQATGVYKAAKHLGIRIGKDLSVVGIDNIQQNDSLNPGLTSVDIHPQDIGRISAELVLKSMRLDKANIDPVILEPELVIRDSVARSG
ncbi:LacI family DNA-binding transcriptional regulator [uncultured Ruegeria sp.]|uniref:LacI family DNA-binding transcriptional regulator n=1 Tax=uncultured Ruegeria sp. TaxID=259304 RepID=UPI002631D8D7|nr:LacI family DNA-binding transcriptional regulator [uncultured Ruegeria sp.]